MNFKIRVKILIKFIWQSILEFDKHVGNNFIIYIKSRPQSFFSVSSKEKRIQQIHCCVLTSFLWFVSFISKLSPLLASSENVSCWNPALNFYTVAKTRAPEYLSCLWHSQTTDKVEEEIKDNNFSSREKFRFSKQRTKRN